MKAPVIFIVDKNPVHRNLLRYHLEVGKFKPVYSFSTGEECLYRLQRNVIPDFLVTSFFTGDHSGFVFLSKVRALAPSVQIIFFDNFDDSQLTDKLLDSGASDVILKTNTPDAGISELIKNIRYLTGRRNIQSVF